MTERSSSSPSHLTVNRAPVLTLWAAVVAERLGFDRAEALTLGKAVAGLNAYAKGVSLGLFQPKPKEVRGTRATLLREEVVQIDFLQRAVVAQRTPEGIRALSKEKPIDPASVEKYLAGKLGEGLAAARSAMEELARALAPGELAERAFDLYEEFRPAIPPGTKGWGVAGILDLDKIRKMAAR
ncbi:MAG TPA: hypothetical protein VGK94_00625 [Candidatus Polarisedimenticolia bacterium]|jgi:hypothetical protein